MARRSGGGDRDYATGKPVDLSKPEERVRQEYERLLVESHGYEKGELDIEVSVPRGSGTFPDRADIVVYRPGAGRDPAADVLGIVETKAPKKTGGLSQIKSYMTATSAVWGVWTNGDDIAYLCKPPGKNEVSEDYLNNIPDRGQSVQDVGSVRKSALRPFGRQELKVVFRRILRSLYSNANISRRERLGNEMIKMIFSKIEDEKTYPDRTPEFRAEAGEPPSEVKARVRRLFQRVKRELEGDRIFEQGEDITLDAKSVAWVVGQLERGSLLTTDTDVVGDAFEVFAESKLVGEKGEFFTPRGVVKLALALADPKPEETICDPACGSGGFLIHAMKHVWEGMERDPRWRGARGLKEAKRTMAQRTIFGIDKESDLVRIAKAYMAISGDGRSNVVFANSLLPPSELGDSAGPAFLEGDDGALRQFDCILTNPPYGATVKVKRDVAKHFVLGRSRGKPCERDPYVLFVERCLEMLKEGGTLAIVLPETAFHAPATKYIRDFVMSRGSVAAVVDLPHNTFRPHCNAKTNLLVLKKGAPPPGGDVVMATTEEMGHDHNGRPLLRPETGEPWDDLSVVMEELSEPGAEGNRHVFLVPREATIEAGNLVPSYHRSLLNPPRAPKGRRGVRLGDLVEEGVVAAWDGHGSPSSSEKGGGKIPYIRVSDIVNWELYRNPVSGVSREAFERLTRSASRTPEEGDVVFVRRGSYRIGTVAMVSPRDREMILTRELLTIRVKKLGNPHAITPFYLLALLSSEFVQRQMESKVFMDTTLPNIGDRWKELILPVHESRREAAEVHRRVETIMRGKWEAQDKIDALRPVMGGLTT